MCKKRLIDANAYAYPGDLINEPTVDAVEVVHGRWEQVGDYYVCGDYCYRCTNCMTDEWMTFAHMKRFLYCPFCGAKMDGERKDK